MKGFKILLAGLLMLGMISSVPMTAEAKDDSGQKKMSKMFFKKIKFIMANTAELGVTDSQAEKIDALKWATKREYLEKKHKIEMLEVDIKQLMYKDKIDVGKVEKLVDQKYDLKEEKAMLFVKAFADLKSILTAEQMGQMKTFFYKKKDCGWGSCSMSSHSSHSKGSMKGSMK